MRDAKVGRMLSYDFSTLYAGLCVYMYLPLDGPRNMIFENLKMSYEYGDIILCRAEGNPAPDYKWISSTNSVFINGSSLTISSDHMAPGDTYSYQCIAVNSKSGTHTSKVINITIDIPVGKQH